MDQIIYKLGFILYEGIINNHFILKFKKKIKEINEIQGGNYMQVANLRKKVRDYGFLIYQRREKAGIFFSDCSTG